MNNFDLRKYLAEGRLKVNEGDMDHLMQDLERELKQHDWFYYMSDDPRSYDKGTDEQRELKRLLKMLNNSPEAIALYNKYAPVQDGIDLRIKEEKRPDYPDVDKDGDTEESMEKALKDKEVKEEYNIGKGMEKDHDFDAMLAHALKLHAGTSIEDLKKVSNDFEAVNYHRENAYLEDAIDMLEAGKHEEFEDSLKLFKDEVKKTIRSFKESIKESLRAWNVIDIDGNVTHEGLSYEEALAKAKEVEGHKIRPTSMMLDEDHDPDQEQLDDEDEIFMPMDDEGKPLEEAISQEVVNKVSRFITSMANYYDYSEQDAVYAIMQALKAHKGNFKGLNEGYYGSSDIDNIVSTIGYDDIDSFFNDNPGAVDAIIQWAETIPDFERMLQDAGMIEEDEDMMQESISKALSDAIDSWTDDEKVRKAAKAFAAYKLHKKGPDPLKDLDDETYHKALDAYRDAKNIDEDLMEGKDSTHKVKYSKSNDTYQVWLGDEIVTDFSTKEKADVEVKRLNALQDAKRIDKAQVGEDLDLGHQDNEPHMLKGDLYKIGKYSMELYQMMDDLEDIHGEVDLPHWWQSKITTAKNVISGAKHYLEFELKEPAIDAMVTEDSLEDQAKVYFMQKVKRGEIDTLPEDPKAAFLVQMTKDQMDHDKETLDREGGLGESSFYTKNVKDKVISKLMDQLKK